MIVEQNLIFLNAPFILYKIPISDGSWDKNLFVKRIFWRLGKNYQNIPESLQNSLYSSLNLIFIIINFHYSIVISINVILKSSIQVAFPSIIVQSPPLPNTILFKDRTVTSLHMAVIE